MIISRHKETSFLFAIIVSDAMQRESAIADDYWSYTLQHGKKDQVEVALQNIERKLIDLKERIHNINTTNQVVNYDQQWFSPDD
ncbi:unnamed protein product [Rotaria magnacalcarata]|uniref:Coil containing protein n=1 Tax=Rotaria magnacalcarata TaxID=392030 RepID=A0A8S2PQY7_9BILA|nr:unnamed protein product [Rotaria magnacalcarata]CAF4066345.1 unnamed protein product [Rotaria magnacalcarata]